MMNSVVILIAPQRNQKTVFELGMGKRRARYKRIIYKKIWVASLTFHSVKATFIDI